MSPELASSAIRTAVRQNRSGPAHSQRLWVALALLVASGAAFRGAAAQGVVIQVVDSIGAPVPFAVVDAGSLTGRVADSAGIARVLNLRGDTLRLRVRRIGYTPFDELVGRTAGADVFLVVLTRVAQEMERVYVRAERSTPLSRNGFYDRIQRVHRGAILGEFITPEELEHRRPMQISHILQGRRYVQVQREGMRGRATLAGRGQCPMTILLDGVRMNQVLEPGQAVGEGRSKAPPPLNMSIDELVEAGSVAAIEIYPSTANAPAELIPLTGGGSCGIVAVWTGGRR